MDWGSLRTYDIGTSCAYRIGRLCQTVDASGTSQYGYDAFGNITTHTRTEAGQTYTTSYSYDAANRVTAITYPDGRGVNYTRDSIGQITQVSTTVNGSPVTLTSNRTYRADGFLTAQTFGNTLTETKSYDLQGRLTQWTLGTDIRNFTYDANGNLTQKTAPTENGAFSYNALDRLIQETVATRSQSFSYDPNGNRTQDGTGTYSYAAASNRLTSAAQGAVSLDAAGNTLTDQGGTRSFTYNNAGELTQVTTAGISTSYSYNAQRQRTKKITATGTTVYHHDLSGNLITETNADGTLIWDYVYTDSTPIAKIEAGETLTYLHTDHLQTPRLATNEQGTKIWSWEGNAFGETLPNEDPDNDSILTTVNLRFPGQYYDAESGLFYNWNRYYDPRTGRYITSDPIGLKGGMNTYVYVNNNPLRWTDPTGLDRYDICKDFGLVLGFICNRCVDLGCYVAPTYCCEVEKKQCQANAAGGNDLAVCEAKWIACMVKANKPPKKSKPEDI